MDAIDRKILAELQTDGRLTITELSARVQLTIAPCHRRLRELETAGVISGYRAVLDTEAVGLGFHSLVFVTMSSSTRQSVDAFEEAVSAMPNIIHAERLFGEPDYLLRVAARDLTHFQTIYDEHLSTLPSMQRLTATLVMRQVVDNRPLPLFLS